MDKEFTLLYLLYLILASIIGDDSRVHVLFGTLTLFLMHERLAKGQPTPPPKNYLSNRMVYPIEVKVGIN